MAQPPVFIKAIKNPSAFVKAGSLSEPHEQAQNVLDRFRAIQLAIYHYPAIRRITDLRSSSTLDVTT